MNKKQNLFFCINVFLIIIFKIIIQKSIYLISDSRNFAIVEFLDSII